MSNHDHLWLLLAAYECAWVILGVHECSRGLTSAHYCSGQLLSAHEHSQAAMHKHNPGNMEQWALMRPQEPSWAFISTHERSWHHSTLLMSAHEPTLGHMRALRWGMFCGASFLLAVWVTQHGGDVGGPPPPLDPWPPPWRPCPPPPIKKILSPPPIKPLPPHHISKKFWRSSHGFSYLWFRLFTNNSHSTCFDWNSDRIAHFWLN